MRLCFFIIILALSKLSCNVDVGSAVSECHHLGILEDLAVCIGNCRKFFRICNEASEAPDTVLVVLNSVVVDLNVYVSCGDLAVNKTVLKYLSTGKVDCELVSGEALYVVLCSVGIFGLCANSDCGVSNFYCYFVAISIVCEFVNNEHTDVSKHISRKSISGKFKCKELTCACVENRISCLGIVAVNIYLHTVDVSTCCYAGSCEVLLNCSKSRSLTGRNSSVISVVISYEIRAFANFSVVVVNKQRNVNETGVVSECKVDHCRSCAVFVLNKAYRRHVDHESVSIGSSNVRNSGKNAGYEHCDDHDH